MGALGKTASRARPSFWRELGDCHNGLGPSLSFRIAAEGFDIFQRQFGLGDRLAIASTSKPSIEPAIHRFTHRLIVVVAGFNGDMLDLLLLTHQAKTTSGVGDALGRLADTELEGVARGVDDQECAGDKGEQVAGRGINRPAHVDLAHQQAVDR